MTEPYRGTDAASPRPEQLSTTEFRAYTLAVISKVFNRFQLGRDMVIGSVAAALSLGLQVHFGLISASSWHGQSMRWIVSAIGPYLCILMIDAFWRAFRAPVLLYQQQENQIANMKLALKEVQLKLGRCEVNIEINKVYVYELRKFRGFIQRRQSVPGQQVQISMVPDYARIDNYAHVVIDVTFSNEGSLPTTVMNPQCKLTIDHKEYIGTLLDEVTGCFIEKEAIPGNPETLTRYSQPSIDIEITSEQPLIRGVKRRGWLHFAIEHLPPVSQKQTLLHLRLSDGLKARHDITAWVEVIRTEIRCEDG